MSDHITYVKIAGILYSLNRVKERQVDHDGGYDNLWGQISYHRASIRYVANSPEREFMCILHELVHGIEEGYTIHEVLIGNNTRHNEDNIEILTIIIADILRSSFFREFTHSNVAEANQRVKELQNQSSGYLDVNVLGITNYYNLSDVRDHLQKQKRTSINSDTRVSVAAMRRTLVAWTIETAVEQLHCTKLLGADGTPNTEAIIRLAHGLCEITDSIGLQLLIPSEPN